MRWTVTLLMLVEHIDEFDSHLRNRLCDGSRISGQDKLQLDANFRLPTSPVHAATIDLSAEIALEKLPGKTAAPPCNGQVIWWARKESNLLDCWSP